MKAQINSILRSFGLELDRHDERPYWPDARQPEIRRSFLFLLTPPNSGSTAIAKYLEARGDIGGLYHNFEGQRVVRAMMDTDRWSPQKFVDYEALLGGWQERIDTLEEVAPFTHWLEKSPPNLVRYRDLFARFPQHRVVVNNRAPLASIASQLKRYHHTEYHDAPREPVLRHLAAIWIWRSRMLMEAVRNEGFACVTYEKFCEDPGAILDAFGLDPQEGSAQVQVQVKDYGPQEIANMNAVQLGLLRDEEKAMLGEILGEARDVLEFFGYDAAS